MCLVVSKIVNNLQIAEELLKLRKEQEELESKLKLRVIGLSLFDTVVQVLEIHRILLYLHLEA